MIYIRVHPSPEWPHLARHCSALWESESIDFVKNLYAVNVTKMTLGCISHFLFDFLTNAILCRDILLRPIERGSVLIEAGTICGCIRDSSLPSGKFSITGQNGRSLMGERSSAHDKPPSASRRLM